MIYLIAFDSLHLNPYVEITESEAIELRQQADQLSAVVELEELYDLLVCDYVDFETLCLAVAVEYSAGRYRSIEAFDDMRRRFNRGLMHVLTLARSYMDCAPRLVARIVASEGARQYFSELTGKEYDRWLGYRVMEALRNSAQHQGLPLHGFEAGFAWVPANSKRHARAHTYSMPTVSLEVLAQDAKFKKSVLAELRAKGPNFDIRPMVREYISSISHIQLQLRRTGFDRIERARVAVGLAIERWRRCSPNLPDYISEGANIYIVDVDEDGRCLKATTLPLRSGNMIDELRSRNPPLSNLNVSFVSNSVDEFGSMKSDKGEAGR